MTIFFVLLALGAVAVIALLAAGKIGQLNDPVVDRYRQDPPNAPLAADDIADLRFATAIRGYRMDDVDEVLTRLTETLRLREAQLAALAPQGVESGEPAASVQPVHESASTTSLAGE
jgi:DivIVA domain-containing protein